MQLSELFWWVLEAMDRMKNIKESFVLFFFNGSKNIFSSESFILIILKEIPLMNLWTFDMWDLFGLGGCLCYDYQGWESGDEGSVASFVLEVLFNVKQNLWTYVFCFQGLR